MHCSCPACGFNAPLLSFTAEQAAGEFAQQMGRVPPQLAHLVYQYLQMFAPAQHRMPWPKAVRVLEPLVQVIEAGQVRHAKRDWPASLPQIAEGLAYMVSKRPELTLPLKSHGYLWTVLAGAADKAEAQAEAKGIEQRRQGRAPEPAAAPVADESAAARVRAIQSLSQELAANRRLGITATQEQLSAQLSKLGYSVADIQFAFSKVPLKASSNQE